MQLFRVIVALVAAMVCGGCGSDEASTLPQATISILAADGGSAPVHVDVEVAHTPPQRTQGLMFRQQLAENRGMLFLFPDDARGGFWMRNTYVPLTIAYIGADGRIQELREGLPLDDQNILVPEEPYRYVLEVNSGWFVRHDRGIGDLVELPPGLPTPE